MNNFELNRWYSKVLRDSVNQGPPKVIFLRVIALVNEQVLLLHLNEWQRVNEHWGAHRDPLQGMIPLFPPATLYGALSYNESLFFLTKQTYKLCPITEFI